MLKQKEYSLKPAQNVKKKHKVVDDEAQNQSSYIYNLNSLYLHYLF